MVQFRSSLSMTRVRTRGDSDDADDRGWNQFHVAAGKGNLKEPMTSPQGCGNDDDDIDTGRQRR